MKFYKRFPGDIQIKTGHLTMAEFGAFDRLLDHYYATEQPLPGDIDRCCGIARAMTKGERVIVARILDEFFVRDSEGRYTQRRADEMIAEAQPKIEAARANGKKGGRPKKAKTETQPEPTGFSTETQTEPNAKASQNQSSFSSSKKKERGASAPPCPDGVDAQVWADWLALRKEKRAKVSTTVLQEAASEAGKAGMSLEAFLRVWCVRGSQGLLAEWIKPNERQPQAGNVWAGAA